VQLARLASVVVHARAVLVLIRWLFLLFATEGPRRRLPPRRATVDMALSGADRESLAFRLPDFSPAGIVSVSHASGSRPRSLRSGSPRDLCLGAYASSRVSSLPEPKHANRPSMGKKKSGAGRSPMPAYLAAVMLFLHARAYASTVFLPTPCAALGAGARGYGDYVSRRVFTISDLVPTASTWVSGFAT